MEDFTTSFGNSVAEAAPADRASFIRRTSLTLFASVALLFWYILTIFSSRD